MNINCTERYMINQFLFHRPFFITLLICFTIACKQSSTPSTSSCSENLISQYKSIANGNLTDSAKLKQLKRLFNSANPNCITPIADSIYTNLLLTWYANPASDSSITTFFSTTYLKESLPLNLRVRAMITLSILYYTQYNLKTMDSCLEIAKNYENEWDSYSLMSYCKSMGMLLLGQNKLQEAALITARGIEVGEREKVKDHLLSDLYTNYGNTYFQIGNYEEAIKIYKKNYLLISNTTKDYTVMQANISNMGLAYQELKKNDSAIDCFKKGLILQPLIGNSENNIQCFSLYLNIGSIYVLENKFDSARFYLNKMIPMLPTLNNPALSKLATIQFTVANAPIMDVSAGIDSIKSYIITFTKANDILNLQNCYTALNKIATLRENDREALKYTLLLDSLKDIASTTENKRVVKEMETKYETTKKDLQIEHQKNTIANNKNIVALLAAVIAFLVFGAVIIVQFIRLKQKNKTEALHTQFTKQLLENTEKERQRIASDLHDGICNDLTIVKQDFINENIKHKIDNILDGIRLIARNLHPEMLTIIGLKDCIENLCNQMSVASDIKISSNISYSDKLNSTNELHLFRLIQEALNNIVKHSGASNAEVIIKEEEEMLQLCIQDDGFGFDVEAALKSGKAFGLLSIMERAKALGGKATYESGEKGSRLVVNL